MIRYILVCILLMSSGNANQSNFVQVGAQNGKYTWVYLGGLTDDFYSESETHHRDILDKIGKELELTFLVPISKNRCAKFGDQLCWPHEDESQTISTYNSINFELGSKQINGWLGFSNGGYFLQELLHYRNLHLPIITIGAAGRIEHDIPIQVMIGNDDTYAYNRGKKLGYKFIQYKGKHEIDYDSLKKILIKTLKNQ